MLYTITIRVRSEPCKPATGVEERRALVVSTVMLPVYACLGHWYVQIAFGVPSAAIFAAMGRDKVRNRMRARKGLEPIKARPKR